MNRGAMSRTFAVLLACVACARLDGEDPAADAGLVDQPRVTGVQPPEGEADPGTAFRVAFSTAMDQGQLVASTGRSESVAIVPESTVDRFPVEGQQIDLSRLERGAGLCRWPAKR